MSELLKKAENFLKRWGIWLLLLIPVIILMKIGGVEIKTITAIFGAEALAIMLSSIALIVYTEIDFINSVKSGTDLSRVITGVFIGVHLLVSIVILGVYLD